MDMHQAAQRMACPGWRPSDMAHLHWLDAVGGHPLFELDVGGAWTGKDYFLIFVQPTLDNPSETYDAFSLRVPAVALRCNQEAASLQEKYGGLYIGMRDSIRSVVHVGDGGQAALQGLCWGCWCLSQNQVFKAAVRRRQLEGGEGSSYSTDSRNDYLTRAQLLAKSEQQAAQGREDRHNAARRQLLAESLAEQQDVASTARQTGLNSQRMRCSKC